MDRAKIGIFGPTERRKRRCGSLGCGPNITAEICAALGISVEDLDAQIASDRAREAALGLSFPPQPQPTPQQGEPDGTP